MHLLIAHAAPPLDDLAEAVAGLALPSLQALLRRLAPRSPDVGPDDSLSPPHERAFAAALGWPQHDGALPWGARAAAADGIDIGDRAWGLVTPAHWQLGHKQVRLLDPSAIGLTDDESRGYADAVRPSFEAAGWTLAWGATQRWYAAHDSLDALPCASLDRAIGRSVDAWLPRSPAARPLRRLQAEVQMVLHDHPLNAAREAAGQAPVNSFWLSGCGRLPTPVAAEDLHVTLDDRLRAPSLRRDWAAWRADWAALDAGPVTALLATLRDGAEAAVTLCGERAAQRHGPERRGWAARVGHRLRPPSLTTLLGDL